MNPATRLTIQGASNPLLRAARRSSVAPGSAWWTRYSSTVHDNDPTTLDREKARNLSNMQHHTSTPHKQHAPGWNEYLATTSEATVKADKSTGTVAEMQSATVEHIASRHPKAGKDAGSGSDGSQLEAGFTKEGVRGPLKDASPPPKDEQERNRDAGGDSELVRRTVHEQREGKWDEGQKTGSEASVKADRKEA
ncbi:hypothetical protein MKEN_00469400 [Mycena kentingensis (nom. inval.)]|nr:hypothetical protein MKEN_00469400 [Mycena kentingensis (nom. inval.)]